MDGGQPFVLEELGQIYYAAKERDEKIFKIPMFSLDDLLYRIFADITFCMALDLKPQNRAGGRDFTRIMFIDQEKLLGQIKGDWQERRQKEHEGILNKNPFDDHVNERIKYYQELVSLGTNKGNELKMACQKYPLPANNNF